MVYFEEREKELKVFQVQISQKSECQKKFLSNLRNNLQFFVRKLFYFSGKKILFSQIIFFSLEIFNLTEEDQRFTRKGK